MAVFARLGRLRQRVIIEGGRAAALQSRSGPPRKAGPTSDAQDERVFDRVDEKG
jgi:hypothetical protein